MGLTGADLGGRGAAFGDPQPQIGTAEPQPAQSQAQLKPCEAAMTSIIYSILQRLRKSITKAAKPVSGKSLGSESRPVCLQSPFSRCFPSPSVMLLLQGIFA